jgi:cytochrome c556
MACGESRAFNMGKLSRIGASLVIAACVCTVADEAVQTPPITSVVPAEDLVAVVDSLRHGVREMAANEQSFLDNSHKVSRDAQTLAAVALALGLDDTEHPLRHSATAVVAAARLLAEAKDYAAAREALDSLDRAFDEKRDSTKPLAPEKVASLGQLMKQCMFAQNRLKRVLRRVADDNEAKCRDAALLSAIAQAMYYDTDHAKTAEQRDLWYRFCGQMRDRAGNLSRAIKATDKEGTERAFQELGQSCEGCHTAFR